MKRSARLLSTLLLSGCSLLASQAQAAKPAPPVKNPSLADSALAVAHGYSDLTPFAGPVGPSRPLAEHEVVWKRVGPINGYAPVFSNPYPNGKRVMWVGGYDRIAKLDADSLEVLTTYSISRNKYYGDDEIQRYVTRADRSTPEQLEALEQQVWREPYRHTATPYHMLSRNNELIIPHIGDDNSMALRMYAESDPADPASDIVLKHEWKLPPSVSTAKVMSVNMTHDGHALMVTQDGVMVALSPDFSQVQTLKLPRKGKEPAQADFFAAFVRNGITVDNNNGIYVVSRDYLYRVQWTGKKLSLDEKDGAWTAPYTNETGTGSGTTPTPMGWGPNEDHLVLITDGTVGNNLVAFWRDAIPADWKGLPGQDRRVAAITKVRFDVPGDDTLQIENAPIVYGYGTFLDNFDNTFVRRNKPKDGAITERADSTTQKDAYLHIPGHDAPGGSRIDWDPATRTLKTVWTSQANFANTVCTVSSGSEMVYCWGFDKGNWSMIGTDWHTGKIAVQYHFGSSKRYDAMGGPVIIDDKGRAICGCSGGMGIVRVQPDK